MPTAWKLSKLCPLLKPGKDPKFVESYRPISLLEFVGKLLERIITTRLEEVVGVPQGSISGPLLFALYHSTLTTEIRAAVNCEVRTVEYADDVNIWLRLRKNADNTYDTTQA